ncbi:hypothetical protein AGMMS4952_25040 [Spirochaetia bacterium]|nr:hypothetical protein AGMMS4952_25040 [Spirochaetia bacterium]
MPAPVTLTPAEEARLVALVSGAPVGEALGLSPGRAAATARDAPHIRLRARKRQDEPYLL